MARYASVAIASVVLLAGVVHAATSRMVPLDDGRTALIEGRTLYIVESGKRVAAPAGNYMTRDHEVFFVSQPGVLERSIRRVDGVDPRVFRPAQGGQSQAVTLADRPILEAVEKRLDTFSQQHHAWFRPVIVDHAAVKFDWMFCSQACEPGVDAQARSAISSITSVKIKSVSGPLASEVCYDGFDLRAGKCTNTGIHLGNTIAN